MSQNKPHLLFICTGNFYRSRLAQLLFAEYASRAGLDWTCSSRGFCEQNGRVGIAPAVVEFLHSKGLEGLLENSGDPNMLSFTDLENASLTIGLCRREHAPQLISRFGQIPRILEQQGRLRYWNVFDLPPRVPLLHRILHPNALPPSQPSDSATEHIDFAVSALVRELKEGFQPGDALPFAPAEARKTEPMPTTSPDSQED